MTSVVIGNIFNLDLSLNSAGAVINNAEGAIVFPRDLLEVVSVNRVGSIFSIWVEEPTFSNQTGQIFFNGGLPTPGYSGSSGKVLSVVFRAKSSGQASFVLAGGSIRANDGLGTDVLTGGGNASVIIQSAPVEKPLPVLPINSVPPATAPIKVKSLLPSRLEAKITSTADSPDLGVPEVKSTTNPDPDGWFNNNEPEMRWTLPENATAVAWNLNRSSESVPVSVGPVIDHKKLSPIEDGVWYFHVRYRTSLGWSPTAHYRLGIDTTAPDNLELNLNRAVDKWPLLEFKTKDKLSGLASYRLAIDNAPPLEIKPEEMMGDYYYLPAQAAGVHSVVVEAIDKANNVTSATASFSFSGSLLPEITSYDSVLTWREKMAFEGKVSPLVQHAQLLVEDENRQIVEFALTFDQYGYFRLSRDLDMKSGSYRAWVRVEDQDHRVLAVSDHVPFAIEKSIVGLAKSLIIDYGISWLWLTIGLLGLGVIVGVYGWYRFFDLRRRLLADFEQAEASLDLAFTVLRRELEKSIKLFEKAKNQRPLTSEEANIIRRFKRHLRETEKYINQEISEIEKTDVD